MNTHVHIKDLQKLRQVPDHSISIALKVLVVIAVLYTLYFCSSLVLPIFVAAFIALFSSPLTRLIEKSGLPRSLAAAFVISLLIFLMVLACVFLVGPASHYLGPLFLLVILTGVGFIEYESIGCVLMVPGVYLLLNFFESQLVTPTVLGKRFNMNPLLVVLWMFVWGWVWGVIGILIAIPMLVFFEILAVHLVLVGGWINILDVSPDSSRC